MVRGMESLNFGSFFEHYKRRIVRDLIFFLYFRVLAASNLPEVLRMVLLEQQFLSLVDFGNKFLTVGAPRSIEYNYHPLMLLHC